MTNHVLANLKAYCALIGTVLTVVLADLTPDSPGYTVLKVVCAVAVAIGVWRVPNTPR